MVSVRSTLLLLVAAFTSCDARRDEAATGPGRPLAVEQLDPGIERGAPLLRLSGGPLPSPVDVPLFVELEDDALEDDALDQKCSLYNDSIVLVLDERHIYVHQYNSRCGGAHACRVYDVERRELAEPPGGCLQVPGAALSHHLTAKAVAPGWYLVVSQSEGVGEAVIATYRPETGQCSDLRFEFGPAGFEVRRSGDGFRVRVPCSFACDRVPFETVHEWNARDAAARVAPCTPGGGRTGSLQSEERGRALRAPP